MVAARFAVAQELHALDLDLLGVGLGFEQAEGNTVIVGGRRADQSQVLLVLTAPPRTEELRLLGVLGNERFPADA